tara:strand:- start:1224 stop:2171 length:948 start_codon:yes stop_codon:yes gene_type:complete
MASLPLGCVKEYIKKQKIYKLSKDPNSAETGQVSITTPKIDISPEGQKLFKMLEQHEGTSCNLLKDFEDDTRKVNEHDKLHYSLQEKYYPDEQNIGIAAEKIVSIYGSCPICNANTLSLFSNPNMPVVDLICTNHNHDINNGPRLWQVKASSTDNYFNNKFITVGSKHWGKSIHENVDNKDFLLGYICLKMDENVGDQNYTIHKSSSFILFPDLDPKPTGESNLEQKPYYSYLTEEEKLKLNLSRYKKKDVIRHNNCKIIGIDLLLEQRSGELEIINHGISVNKDGLAKYFPNNNKRKIDGLSGGVYKYKIKYTY